MSVATAVTSEEIDPWSAIVGQPGAVNQLRAAVASPVHAYLLVGPRGAGKKTAAAVFAAELLIATDPRIEREPLRAERHRRLATTGEHPNIFVITPGGNQLRRGTEVAALIAEANRVPAEGGRKILVINRFHTATPEAAAALLKPIEEPTSSTIWVLLSNEVPQAHVTIASRSVRVDFSALSDHDIATVLVSEGLASQTEARLIAAAAGGNLERARLLATDAHVAARRETWWSIPERLDGTGATVAQLVDEVRSSINGASSALVAQHKIEMTSLAEREELLGTRGSGRRDTEARHRREQRQLRTDELRFGLATLSSRYREEVVGTQDERAMLAIARLRQTSEALVRNPNEALALQCLLLDLPKLNPASQSNHHTST